MCRSPAGRGDVHIDGKKTGQKVIPKCQEYLRMKSSILSDNNMVEFLANDDKVQEQKTKFENAKGTVRNSRYDIITLLITPEVALFATPPFRNTAPFSQHFFNEFVFCLGTPFRNTSLDQKDFRPENWRKWTEMTKNGSRNA